MSSGPPRRRRSTPSYPAGSRPPDRPGGSSGRRSYALPIALLVLTVVVGLVALAGYRILLPSGNPVELPKFIGQQLVDAQSAAAAARVSLRVIAHHPDDRTAKGVVVGQFPAPGEYVREGRAVDIIVSDGPSLAIVPNLANMSLRDAEVALANARLSIGTVTTEATSAITEGRILTQHPDAFTSVPAGSKIDLTIAKGRAEVFAPNFVGLTLTFSQSAAKQAGVVLGTPMWMQIAPNARPKGTVVAQDPLPGQPIDGQKIVLQVSSGPPATPTPVPTVAPVQTDTPVPETPQPSPSAEAPASASPGQQARGLRVAVQLPSSTTPKHVRIALVDATGSRDLYDQVTAGGFTLSFDVTVTGTGTIQTYIDGALTTSTPL